MIPLLIGAAVAGVAAVALSDDKPEQTATQNKQFISENQVQNRLNRAGRRIKTIGQDAPPVSSGMHFICSGDIDADIEKIDNMINSPHVSDEFTISAIRTFERYYGINVLD